MRVCCEYLLERGDRKRFEVESPRVASIERFGIAEEHFVHETVYAAAEHEVDAGLAVQLIPDPCDLAVNFRCCAVEFLEFIHNERKRGGHGFFHDKAEDVGKAVDAPWHGASESTCDFALDILTDG